MLNKQTQLKLTDLMQDQITDLDIYREKPFVFDNGQGLLLIVKPVLFKEHDIFLKDMSKIIIENYEIFANLDFLSHENYKEKESVDKLVAKVSIYTANKKYSVFKKRATKFILKWSFVNKKKRIIKYTHNKRLCKQFLNSIEPSEFVYILFLLFVMNFDIVKKNLLELMKMFQKDLIIEFNIQMGTSSLGILEKVVVMPKYSVEPFNKLTLDLLEQQSKI